MTSSEPFDPQTADRDARLAGIGLTAAEGAERLASGGRATSILLPALPDRLFLPAVLFDPPMIAATAVASLLVLGGADTMSETVAVASVGLLWIVLLLLWSVGSRRTVQSLSAARRYASVLRDGEVRGIPASELVPGDAVVLLPGTRAPAAVRVEEAEGLRLESAPDAPLAAGETFGPDDLVGAGSGIGILEDWPDREAEADDLGAPIRTGRWSIFTRCWAEAALLTALAVVPAALVAVFSSVSGLTDDGGSAVLFLACLLLLARPGTAVTAGLALAGGLSRAKAGGVVARSLEAFESLGLMGYVCTDRSTLFATGTLRDASRAIADARAARVRVAILTEADADQVEKDGRELGLISPFESTVTGESLDEAARKGQPSVDNLVRPIRIFSETEPRHASLVIDSFRRDDHLVAATVLGPEDQPALASAELAIAPAGAATDYAAERAGIILEEPRIPPLLAGVAAARGAFARLRRHLRTAFGTGAGLVLVMLAAPFLISGNAVPPLGLLILAIGLALLPSGAMAFERDRFPTDARSPRRSFEPLQPRAGRERGLMSGLLIAVVGLAVLYGLARLGTEPAHISAAMLVAFASLAAAHLCMSAGERGLGPLRNGVPSFLAATAGVVLTVAAVAVLPAFAAPHLQAPEAMALGLGAGPALLAVEAIVRRAPRKRARVRSRRRST